MNPLARFLLRAKHWQIFILTISPLILALTVASYPEWNPLSLTEGFGGSELTKVLLISLFICCNLAWLWAAGTFPNSIVLLALRMKTGIFRFSLVLVLCYSALRANDFGSDQWELTLIALLDALATFCSFYLLYFVSKNLVSAETGKPAGFFDYAGTLLRIWFFPVGVWTIQPRINELYEKSLSPAGEI